MAVRRGEQQPWPQAEVRVAVPDPRGRISAGARDRAMLLLGFADALRRSEPVCGWMWNT